MRARPLGATVVVLFVVGVAACQGDANRTSDGPRATTPPTTSTVSPSTTTTSGPDVTPAPTPANVDDPRVSWYYHPAPGNSRILLGVVPSRLPGPHPAIVLVPGASGFSTDYLDLAEDLAARGFDVGSGCWWANFPLPSDTPTSLRILCPDAPTFKGITDAAVLDLDALVEGISHVLGEPSDMVVLGFSLGGGIAALRGAYGRPEAVISVSGLVEGFGVADVNDVNVVERAGGTVAPVLIMHGIADTLVPVEQAYHYENALRAAGKDVEAHYYEGVGHGLFEVPDVRADMLDTISAFICARYTCAAP